MLKNIEKQILDNLQGISYPIKRAEFTCGTLYLELDEENQCDLVHEAIRNHYIENINPDGGVNMWYVGGEFAFDFVPAEDEQITNNEFFGTDEPAGAFTFGKDEPVDSKIDTALNLEAEMAKGK